MNLFQKLQALWIKTPLPVRRWIKGAEVAVVTAVVTAFVGAPAADFTTGEGITKFAAGVAAAAYGGLRLYLAQSPLATVVRESVVTEETTKTTTIQEHAALTPAPVPLASPLPADHGSDG